VVKSLLVVVVRVVPTVPVVDMLLALEAPPKVEVAVAVTPTAAAMLRLKGTPM
jgi:hypothetical protein